LQLLAVRSLLSGCGSTSHRLSPGRASYSKATLVDLISAAFHVQRRQISGPSWLTSEYFAVTVTMPPATTLAEFSQMMETLLV